MARVIHADLIGAARQCVEGGIELDAREAEDDLHAVSMQCVDQEVGAGDGGARRCHWSIVDLSGIDVRCVAIGLCETVSQHSSYYVKVLDQPKGGFTVQVPENVTGVRRRRGRAVQPDGLGQIVDRINGLVSRNRELETENQRLQKMLEEIRGMLNVTDGRAVASAARRRRKSPSPEVLEKRREALAKARAVRLAKIRAQREEAPPA